MTAAGLLPVSGVALYLREPTGEDEQLVLSDSTSPSAAILALASRLASDAAGAPLDWPELPAVDLDATALLIRGAWIGERIQTETICPRGDCGEAIDVAFGVSEYLEHHRPRHFRGLERHESGWLGFAGSELRFRVPTVADLLEVLQDPAGSRALSARCVRPTRPPAAAARRISRALERIAPQLDDEVSGVCPACGARVELHFDPVGYVLAELRDAASELYGDIHELALAYHWSEDAILALARRRRASYVAKVREEIVLA